ncbi:uncharacterized protein LOC117518461 [Thalassophryne amazonica]|uniref:uncharacterized protein LOC117518461 n=1 Tax=Thalassophryne amazonica TaxID=390379 RepID=UPI001471A5D4|nr:uncharacterized protein LOC117518461 [Thalassophryne amazonica]
MVHSGSPSPMKTTQSASGRLSFSTVVSNQGRTQTATKRLTAALKGTSDHTRQSTPANAKPSVLTRVKALKTKSSPASHRSSTHTPPSAQGTVNGRTSGRKRTPKACDCCGPHGRGHNVGIPSRSRGRGKPRGRGSGVSRDSGHPTKRKMGSRLTRVERLDLSNESEEEEVDDEDFSDKKAQTIAVANTVGSKLQKPPDVPVTVSARDGRVQNCAPKNVRAQKKAGGSVGLRTRGRGTPSERGRVRGGRGAKMGVKTKIKSAGRVLVSDSGACVPAGSVVVQSKENPLEAEIEPMENTECGSAEVSVGNGGTANPPGATTKEGAVKDMTTTETRTGLLSVSVLSCSSAGSSIPQDIDLEVDQVCHSPDTLSQPVTLSNGNILNQTNHDHSATPAAEKALHPSVVTPPCPISLCAVQHRWALRDHRLYCWPGTWEVAKVEEKVSGKDQGEADRRELAGQMQVEDRLEELTEMIHEFLESFYIKYGSFIPLSETDVLEYLKNKCSCDVKDSELNISAEVRRYRAGLASAPVAGFGVMYNKHTLSLEDLSTLEEQNWLNDQIINMYGELIMEATQQKVHFFNSFFHKQLVAKGYEGVKRWTKKIDLFSKWLLLIPIHLEIHWSLVTVTMATKTINYYDSQGIVFRHTTQNILKYLQSEAKEKKQTGFQKGWKVAVIKGIPQQKNDSDCGVFVLEYCRRLSLKQPLLFSQEDMPHIRKRIYKELCDCHLNN